ncbi:MAG: thiamine ABC transporter substrate-binding protein [Candidatus Heimdallarchaeota archaeon]|nr:MAG: thiamine ABC transporter substrate-binding protein [Candidatus Heimdallarchaeota archaeon]
MIKEVKKPSYGIYLKRALVMAILIFSASLVIVQVSSSSNHPNTTNQTPTLTIYTYDSLINWGLNPTDANARVFDAFEAQEDCIIELEYFDDANSVLAKAVAEKNSPKADIIIGIDNVLIYEAKAQDILIPYEASTMSNLLESAVNGLDPEHYVTPYDYGLIAIIYHKHLVNSTNVPTIDNLKLEDLLSPEVTQLLVTEDPTLSSTGLGFLMWTIGIYEKVLNKDWELWWNDTRNDIQVEDSWGDAFDVFYTPAANRPMVVSYGTDPAYDYLFYGEPGGTPSIGATVSHENNSEYGWLQIEGLGILKGTKNLSLAQKFIDWFTGKTVQEIIPENNWMYPANVLAELPDSYDYAIDPTTVKPLNDLFTTNELKESIDIWLETWEQVIILGYTSTATPLPPSLFFLIPIMIVVIRKKSRRR